MVSAVFWVCSARHAAMRMSAACMARDRASEGPVSLRQSDSVMRADPLRRKRARRAWRYGMLEMWVFILWPNCRSSEMAMKEGPMMADIFQSGSSQLRVW